MIRWVKKAGLLTVLVASAVASLPERPTAQDARPEGAQVAEPGQPGASLGKDVWPDKAMTDEAAAAAGRSRLPFTTEQIELLGLLLQQHQAATARARGPEPAGRVRRVRLDALGASGVPGIAVRAGYVTSVGFFDRTGAPWPIDGVLADERFGMSKRDSSPHLVHFSPSKRWVVGNASVMLEGLAEPVMLLLGERDGVADFRVDLRLAGAGPNADPLAEAGEGGFHAGSDLLLALLSGEAPAGAVPVDVEGIDGRAWRFGKELLLVTRGHVLSPGPRAAERDSSGRWAYRLPGVPYAMVSEDGRESRAAFQERPEMPRPAREK